MNPLNELDFGWEDVEEKLRRSRQVPPEEKLRMLQESLEFFTAAKLEGRGPDRDIATPTSRRAPKPPDAE